MQGCWRLEARERIEWEDVRETLEQHHDREEGGQLVLEGEEWDGDEEEDDEEDGVHL
jgi:hypothetical protein